MERRKAKKRAARPVNHSVLTVEFGRRVIATQHAQQIARKGDGHATSEELDTD